MKQASNGFFPRITFENDDSSPMYRRLYDWFRSAILAGELCPGRKIPSTRYLASELKVSRITVLCAFQQLSAEGYIETSAGSGTYVARSIPAQVTRLGPGMQPRMIHHCRCVESRRISQLSAKLSSFPTPPFGLETFRVGLPALDHFPVAIWSRLVARRWRQPKKEMLMYGDRMGFWPCREAIAEYLSAVRGVRCNAAQVIIVNGAQQGLALSARALLDPGDQVWIEEPGYPGAVEAFRGVTDNLTPVPIDEHGLDVKERHSPLPRSESSIHYSLSSIPNGHDHEHRTQNDALRLGFP